MNEIDELCQTINNIWGKYPNSKAAIKIVRGVSDDDRNKYSLGDICNLMGYEDMNDDIIVDAMMGLGILCGSSHYIMKFVVEGEYPFFILTDDFIQMRKRS